MQQPSTSKTFNTAEEMLNLEERSHPPPNEAISISYSVIENLNIYHLAGDENSKQKESFFQHLKSLYYNLQLSLRENAKIKSSTIDESGIDIISDIPIMTVPLHIRPDEPKEWLDNHWHFHKRNDIVNRLNEVPKGEHFYTQSQELLRDAAKMAEKNSAKLNTNHDAKKQYQLRRGNIVGIVGQAGVGKTTYIKQLIQKILNTEREIMTTDRMYIFYFAFRDVRYDIETTMLDFLTTSCGLSNWKTTPEEDFAITEFLAMEENVMIFMDGYDEAHIPKSSLKCPLIKFDQKAKAHVFISNLIRGHIFPFAKKFVSSRPRQLYEMDNETIPHFVVKILGLDYKGQQSIISNVCGQNKDKVQKLFEKYPDINAICHTPLNCIITAYCFNQTTNEFQTENQLYTITTIMVTVIGIYSKNESEKTSGGEFQTKELSGIAWKMFEAKEFYVDAKSLNFGDIKEDNLTGFLTTSKGWKKNLPILSGFKTRKVYFSHLILEEFFVALNFRFFMDFEEFRNISEHIDQDQYEVVSKFLYGMFNQVTIECLKEFLPDCFYSKHLEKEKLDLLKNIIISKLNSIPNLVTPKKKFAAILQVSSWLYEMKNDHFTKQISLPETIVISADSILPGEIAPFIYLLQFTKKTKELKIQKTKFEKNSLDLFLDGLSKIFSKIKLTELGLCFTRINEKKMKKLSGYLINVKNLKLYGCELPSESMKILSSTINHYEIKLQTLEFFKSKIGDEGAGHVSTIVQYIENLYLRSCNITAVGAKRLCHGLQNSDLKMDELDITLNKIGDEGFTAFSEVVHKVSSLYIGNPNDQNLTMKGISNLCEEIRNQTTPMILHISCKSILEEKAEAMLMELQELGKLKDYFVL